MFRSRRRKLKILFGFAAAVLTAIAFGPAYRVRDFCLSIASFS
jgi:hypothetical protein